MNEMKQACYEQKLILWAGRIRDRQSSGQTVTQWCKENHWSKPTYYLWQKRVRQAALDRIPSDQRPTFVEVHIEKSSSSTVCTAPVQIQKGELSISVSNQADPDLLKALIAAL